MRITDRGTIVLLNSNSLCYQPRVVKEATALATAGYEVYVLGAWLEPDGKARDQHILRQVPFHYVSVLDATLRGFRNFAIHFAQQGSRKVANHLHGIAGWESRYQLGPATQRLLACAKKIPAQLFIAHSEPALYTAWRLMQAGRSVGVDMEDWFSEDLLPDARKHRPLGLIRRIESEVLAAGAYASCPSHSMSEALAMEYGCKPPVVIYNAFPMAERQAIDGLRKDRRKWRGISLCWYSQTLGPGRGLEDLVAALPLVQRDIEIHFRGRAVLGMEEWLRSRLPERWQQRVFFHPQVLTDELVSRIAEHDIGFAGEMKYCRSRDLTVTNKILHYLLGGLAVVASDTAGQREVAKRAPGAVELYRCGNPPEIAKALNSFVTSPERLARAKAASLQAAKNMFCWEQQEEILLAGIGRALRQTTVTSRQIS
jgi:hypothetical protein